MRIAVCCSADFYRQANEISEDLKRLGFAVSLPATAEIMHKRGDYDVSHYKTWFKNSSDYHKKAELMRGHFEKIAKSDCILVINNQKHDQSNYIGGNVLMEMALAFYLHKPIYLLNQIPEQSSFLEEIRGMSPVELHNDLTKLPST